MNRNYDLALLLLFQRNSLELRFSRYCQMSGSRFLIELREVELPEHELLTTSLSKESIDII